ncbi:MAG TPA: surface-adhesin E family protein [Pyrinomonadaceae bacterium]
MRIAILCALLLLTASQWRLVGETTQERFYVSDERTDRDGDRVKRWEKIEPSTEARRLEYVRLLAGFVGEKKAAVFSHDLARREYDCPRGEARTVQQLYQDGRGRLIYETPAEDLGRWRSPAPDSAEETLMLDACKRPIEQN